MNFVGIFDSWVIACERVGEQNHHNSDEHVLRVEVSCSFSCLVAKPALRAVGKNAMHLEVDVGTGEDDEARVSRRSAWSNLSVV